MQEQQSDGLICDAVDKFDVATQSDDKPIVLICSAGTQTNNIQTCDIGIQCDEEAVSEAFDQSFELFSEDEKDDSDNEYFPSSQETVSSVSQHSQASDPFDNDQLVLVHMESLKPLFSHCPCCGSVVEMDNIQVQSKGGALLTVQLVCNNGCSSKWRSQNDSNNSVSVNLKLTSAVALSGIMFDKFQQMASILNLKSVSHDTFYRLRRDYLFPSIAEEWKKEQSMVIESIKGREEDLMLAGDGRCDSPGHSAKYGTYTMIDTDTDKVVDFEVIRVMEVKNSNAMEKEGFIRTLTRVEEDYGCKVYGISTDRHTQIKKYMREQQKKKI